MKVGSRIKFAKIDQKADSLHSLIADGQHRATSLGRDAWKDLIGSDASLQVNCNIEGFNVEGTSRRHSRAKPMFFFARGKIIYLPPSPSEKWSKPTIFIS